MNKILHISAECYPAAKVGGLADVAGALPKYLNRLGQESSVIIPKYHTPWIRDCETRILFEGATPSGPDKYYFTVEEVIGSDLGFPLYLVGIPGLFDKEGIYSDPGTGVPFPDEMVRFFSFQAAVLEWMMQMEERQMGQKPDLVHCHDHHTALIPFMMTRCYRYSKLRVLPTVLTIHNAEYQGI